MVAAVIIHQARGLLKTTRPSFLGPRLGLRAAAAAVRRNDATPPPGSTRRRMLAGVLLYTTAGSTIVADDHQVIKTARARHLPTGGIFSKFDQATSGEIESEARQLELD